MSITRHQKVGVLGVGGVVGSVVLLDVVSAEVAKITRRVLEEYGTMRIRTTCHL